MCVVVRWVVRCSQPDHVRPNRAAHARAACLQQRTLAVACCWLLFFCVVLFVRLSCLPCCCGAHAHAHRCTSSSTDRDAARVWMGAREEWLHWFPYEHRRTTFYLLESCFLGLFLHFFFVQLRMSWLRSYSFPQDLPFSVRLLLRLAAAHTVILYDVQCASCNTQNAKSS